MSLEEVAAHARGSMERLLKEKQEMMAAVRERRAVMHEKVVEYEGGTPRALTSSKVQ